MKFIPKKKKYIDYLNRIRSKTSMFKRKCKYKYYAKYIHSEAFGHIYMLVNIQTIFYSGLWHLSII